MITLRFKGIVAAAVAFALVGCAIDRSFGTAPGIEVAQLEELPPPSTGLAYTIGGQETLEITVVGSDILTGEFLTDANGTIAYPLLGEVELAGLTPMDAGRRIADRLRGRYIVNPQVRVRPRDISAPALSVGGEVSKPGTYPSATSPSLIRAVNQAGGLTEYAKNDDVLIMRTVDGQRYIGIYNIRAIQRGNYDDPALYPGDIVMVGDSPARRRFDSIIQYFSLFSSSILLIDRVAR